MMSPKASIYFSLVPKQLGLCFVLFCFVLHTISSKLDLHEGETLHSLVERFQILKFCNFLVYKETHFVQKFLEEPRLFAFRFISSGKMWQ